MFFFYKQLYNEKKRRDFNANWHTIFFRAITYKKKTWWWDYGNVQTG